MVVHLTAFSSPGGSRTPVHRVSPRLSPPLLSPSLPLLSSSLGPPSLDVLPPQRLVRALPPILVFLTLPLPRRCVIPPNWLVLPLAHTSPLLLPSVLPRQHAVMTTPTPLLITSPTCLAKPQRLLTVSVSIKNSKTIKLT